MNLSLSYKNTLNNNKGPCFGIKYMKNKMRGEEKLKHRFTPHEPHAVLLLWVIVLCNNKKKKKSLLYKNKDYAFYLFTFLKKKKKWTVTYNSNQSTPLITFHFVDMCNVSRNDWSKLMGTAVITWPHENGPHVVNVSILFSTCIWGDTDTQKTTMIEAHWLYHCWQPLIISTDEEEEWTTLSSISWRFRLFPIIPCIIISRSLKASVWRSARQHVGVLRQMLRGRVWITNSF